METNNSYVVYVHIVPNEKRYYGMSQNVEQRWRNNGCAYKQNNPEFYNDILFYGWDNIQHIIVAKGLSKDEAIWLEEELIRTNRTYDNEYGYNKYIGNKWTDEQKEAMSGINHPQYGKPLSDKTKAKLSKINTGKIVSEETRKRLSEANKDKVRSEETRKRLSEAKAGINNPMFGKRGVDCPNYGRVVSDKTKQQISEKLKGANSPNAKSCICITTMMVFDTITEAANYYEVNGSNISACCKGRKKSAGKLSDGTKLVWSYLYTKEL